MMQSVEIWRLIEKLVPEARVIEVFPTAAARNLLPSTDWAMPLQLLAGDTGWRKGYKDLCDAAIAALVAAGFLEGTIGCWGEDDEVNPIYGK
jgi:predicted nuclease with RNAse H fold